MKFGIYNIDAIFLRRLKAIVTATGAKIVISSNWRFSKNTRAALDCNLAEFGIFDSVIGETPDLNIFNRHQEIRKWLFENNFPIDGKFAVVDDLPSACLAEYPKSFFLTNDDMGLTAEIANKIILHLNS